MWRTNLYNGLVLIGDRHPSQIRGTVLDRILEMTSETLKLHNTYIQDLMSSRDLPNQYEQEIIILSQRAAPAKV
jgi:hypothetical protein